MQPYFSLILPVYNVEKYLDRCMHSILAQDFDDYEVILVDDGSTDRCGEICDSYAKKHAHVRVIHKPNGGLSSARNAGLDAAQGEYIWFIDSDDWIENGALNILHAAGRGMKPDILKFNHFRAGETSEEIRCNIAAGSYEGENKKILLEKAFCSGGKYVLSAWSHVYRREMLADTGIKFVSEREIGSEDYLFNLSLLPRMDKMLVLEAALYNYDKREGSLTRKYRPMLAKQYARLHALLLESYDGMAEYAALIHRFYVWHLVYGTCIPHEYYFITPDHSLRDGRKNVRRLFREKGFRAALSSSDRKNLPLSKKIQMIAMMLDFEPLFYYLFVIKPGRKTGKA